MTPENARIVSERLALRDTPIYELISPLFLDASYPDAMETFDTICTVSRTPGVPLANHRNLRARAFVYAMLHPEDPVMVLSVAAARYMALPPAEIPGNRGPNQRPSAIQAFQSLHYQKPVYPHPAPGKYTLDDGSRLAVTETGCAVQRVVTDAEAARLYATRRSHLTVVGGRNG